MCWARCPACCSVVGSVLIRGDFFAVEGIIPLELTWLLTPFPQNSFGWAYNPRSSLCTHAFHRIDKKSWRSCRRRVNAGNKNTFSMHHPRRRNVTTSVVGSKTCQLRKDVAQYGEAQRCGWGAQKKKMKRSGCEQDFCCSVENRRFVQFSEVVYFMGRRLLSVGCLTSQQQASVSQGRICTDNFTCCHTEIEATDPTFHLTQSQYTDTRPTSPSASGIRTRDLPLSRRMPYH